MGVIWRRCECGFLFLFLFFGVNKSRAFFPTRVQNEQEPHKEASDEQFYEWFEILSFELFMRLGLPLQIMI